jgi:hypothetical protein
MAKGMVRQGERCIAKASGEMERRHEGDKFFYGEPMMYQIFCLALNLHNT